MFLCFSFLESELFNLLIIALFLLLISMHVIPLCLKLFSYDTYVEITPAFVRIADFEKVFWTDVVSVTDYASYSGRCFSPLDHWWFIDVKNASKYKLTFTQKLNGLYRHSSFYILQKFLSSNDRKQLAEALQKYSPLYEHKSSDRRL